MKRIIFFICFIFVMLSASAQLISLVTSGNGNTKNEATTMALRSAIEQAFGTFVSANTAILNDELIKDEISTVSSGNIKSYKVLSSRKTDKNYDVTISAVVSINKLISYAKAHGSNAEFAGQEFLMNFKMKELNKQNEKKALDNYLTYLKALKNNLFDFSIEVRNPKYKNENEWRLPVRVEITTNENYETIINELYRILNSLSLSETEIKEYKKENIPVYELNIREAYFLYDGGMGINYKKGLETYYLRNGSGDFMKEFCETMNEAQQSGFIREIGGKVKCPTPIATEYITGVWGSGISCIEVKLTESDENYIRKAIKNEQSRFYNNLSALRNVCYPTLMPKKKKITLGYKWVELPYTMEELSNVSGLELVTGEAIN